MFAAESSRNSCWWRSRWGCMPGRRLWWWRWRWSRWRWWSSSTRGTCPHGPWAGHPPSGCSPSPSHWHWGGGFCGYFVRQLKNYEVCNQEICFNLLTGRIEAVPFTIIVNETFSHNSAIVCLDYLSSSSPSVRADILLRSTRVSCEKLCWHKSWLKK